MLVRCFLMGCSVLVAGSGAAKEAGEKASGTAKELGDKAEQKFA